MYSEIQLKIVGLVYNQSVAGTYGLVLAETEGNRRFSVMIGETEAQSIALKMNHKKSPRPLTHDLILNMLTVFSSSLEKVVIYNMVDDVFYSELYIRKDDSTLVVDARTSDAIAIAVRSDSPIFIREQILNIVGMEIDAKTEITNDDNNSLDVNAEDLTVEELELLSELDLQEILNMAISEEKYELAVRLRDALKRKKSAE